MAITGTVSAAVRSESPVGIYCKHLYALTFRVVEKADAIAAAPEPARSASPRLDRSLRTVREAREVSARERALGEILAREKRHRLSVYTYPFRPLLLAPPAVSPGSSFALCGKTELSVS